ncbi:hypothetical protein MSAN_00967500 [Mycena sanguinolenta]|uniref:Uncharacterized protein n=1 Tax=Mycena sanguinolenta TaxID=230812 RepID=A0A8H6YYE2_9AGAR|nr:hypothetical protein MSAN_00967500 [Mycena sanguinolenta]
MPQSKSPGVIKNGWICKISSQAADRPSQVGNVMLYRSKIYCNGIKMCPCRTNGRKSLWAVYFLSVFRLRFIKINIGGCGALAPCCGVFVMQAAVEHIVQGSSFNLTIVCVSTVIAERGFKLERATAIRTRSVL